jgi:hypothetical protein
VGLVAVAATLLVSTAALAYSWNPALVLRAGSFTPSDPDLAALGPFVAATWFEPSGPDSVWVADSTDSGGTFGTAQPVFNAPGQPTRDGAVFAGPTQEHHIAWVEKVGNGTRVYMAELPFGGTLSTPILVSTNTGSSKTRNPVIGAEGNFIVVAYQDSTGGWKAHARVYDISVPGWVSHIVLPGGAPLGKGGPSLAAGGGVLLAWTKANGTIGRRVGTIGGFGTTFAWGTNATVANGKSAIVVLAGVSLLLYERNADVFRRLSNDGGQTFGTETKVLDGSFGTSTSAGDEYRLYDAVAYDLGFVFTAATGPGSPALGTSYRVTSNNAGTSWTKSPALPYAGDRRQLARTINAGGGPEKLAEAWLKVNPNSATWPLKYHWES